jgi:hypothetical protein
MTKTVMSRHPVHRRAADEVSSASPPVPGRGMPAAERQLRSVAAHAGFRTMTALAATAGVNRHTLLAATAGKKRPQTAVVERIARALGVEASVLRELFDYARATRPREQQP